MAMAKRMNKNLVGVLTLLSVATTTGAGIVMVALLPEKDPTFYTDQAVMAIEAGQYAKAAGLYRKAYKVSQDVSHLASAAEMLYENGDPPRALRLLDMAVAADNTFLDGFLEILRIRLELIRQTTDGQPDKDVARWQSILETCTAIERLDADQADMLQARGLARISLRSESAENQDKGMEDLRRAVELDQSDPGKSHDLAVQYEVLLKDWDRAESVLRNLIERNPDNATSHRFYGRFLARRAAGGGPDDQVAQWRRQAVAELERAVEIDPNDAGNHISLGRVCAGQEANLEKAERCFLKATEVDKDGYSSFLSLGLLYLQQDQPIKALEVFRDRLKRPPARLGHLAYMRRINHFMLLRHAQMVTLRLARQEQDPPKRDAYIQEAEGYLRDGIREVGENALTHQMQGEIHMARNRVRDAVREFEEADKLSRGVSQDLKRKLATAYRRDNSPGPARSTLLDLLRAETASRGRGTAATLLALARIENELQNPTQSLVYTDQVLKESPNHKQAITLQMESYHLLGQEDRVAALSARIESDDLESKIRNARVAVMQERFDEAEALFKEMISEPPPKPNVVQLYADLLLDQGRRDEAKAIIEEAAKLLPDNHRLAALRIVLRDDVTPEQREKLLLELYESIEDDLTREMQLADHHARKGKDAFPKAIEHYRRAEKILANEKPTSPAHGEYLRQMSAKVIENQFGMSIVLRDWGAAGDLVDRAGARNIDGAKGLFYQGRFALAKNDPTRAMEYIRAGLEIHPTSPRGWQYLGGILLEAGQHDEARSAFERALEINPNHGRAHLGLARLYTVLNDPVKMEKHFQECLRLVPNDPWVRRQVLLREEQEDPAKGIARREKLRDTDPDDAQNLTKLASLYHLNGEDEKARAAILAAVDAAPADAAIASAAAGFFLRLNDDSEGVGEDILKRFARQAADDPARSRARLLLARHYSALGRSAQARQAFEQAARLDPSPEVCLSIGQWNQSGGRWDEAVDWYRKCVERMDKPSMYVHRLLLDAIVNSTKLDDALVQADRYRRNFPDDPVVILYEGRLALAQGRLDDADRHFDLYLEKDQTAALGYFLRGHLRYLRNQYETAIEDLKRAKALEPRGFEYQHRIELAQVYGDFGREDQEIIELNAILQEDPKAYYVAEAMINVYQRTGNFTDLEAFALRYENLDPDNPKWPMARARALAALNRPQEELDALAKACKLSEFDPDVVTRAGQRMIRYNLHKRLMEMIEQKVPAERRTPELLRQLARAQVMSGDEEKGRETYDLALKAAITEHQAYTDVAVDLSRVFGKEEVLDRARKRLAKNPQDYSAARLLAEVLMLEQAGSSEARQILSNLLKTETDDRRRLPVLIRLGINVNAREELELAVGYYKQILTIDPDNALALNNLAYVLAESMNQPAEALPYAVRAARVRRSASIFDTLGWTYYLLGDYDNSVAWLIRAKDADRDLIVASYHLARAYHKQGDNASAAKEIRNAHRLATARKDETYAKDIAQAMREIGARPGP